MKARRGDPKSSGTKGLFDEFPAVENLVAPLPRARELPSETARFLRVAVPVPLGQPFTYFIEGALRDLSGCRVVVEFGRRKLLAVVLGDAPSPSGEALGKVKPVLLVLDEEPAIPSELLSFLRELSSYYFAPIGEVLRLALPTLERTLAEEAKQVGLGEKSIGRLVLTAEATAARLEEETKLRGQQKLVLDTLRAEGKASVSALTERHKNAGAALRALEKLGLVALTRQLKRVDPFFNEEMPRDRPPELNDEQARAVSAIDRATEERSPKTFLLDGVTASGKTEVYLHAASACLDRGEGVIVLVPEIALTPQLVGRFRARLGNDLAVLHSGLTESARQEMWKRLRSGEVKLAIGARSALFAPVQNLRLICIDEEHDPSYKQEEGVRYHARDMARLRAHRALAVTVLGSATPSVATEFGARSGKLDRLVLRKRAKENALLPQVELVDLTKMGPGPSGDPLLSLPLHRAIEATLAAGKQTILFLNRRGFAPSLVCESCGSVTMCPNCAVSLTVHKKGGARLECHYCGHREALLSKCRECGGFEVVEEGLGTERVEALLLEQFPSARVARLDRDVASGQKSEAILEKMRRGEFDILVGTQMVTKGHDLPRVTLVGVLNADSALSLPDFRASERTFHQLVQVAGRAGRDTDPGRVLIQTRIPTHPAIACAKTHDVGSFFEHELQMRSEVGYPPYTHLALVRLDGLSDAVVRKIAADIGHRLEKISERVEVLGPSPAPLMKLGNRYRYRILLRCTERAPLRKVLATLAHFVPPNQVRLSLDVDPMSLL